MPKIVDKPKMRAQILDAAMLCFTQKGYHATKMADVARQAGMAKGTLYLYFTGKDEVILTLIQSYFGQIRAEIESLPAPHSLEDYLSLLRMIVSLEKRKMTALIFEILGPGFTDPRGVQIIGGFFDWLAGHWAQHFADLAASGQIRSDNDPKVLARAVIAMLDGLFLHLTVFSPEEPLAVARREAALTLIASGLKG